MGIKEKYTEEHLKRAFHLEAHMADGWCLSVSDLNGNLIKQLDWYDFGFDDDDEFTAKEMQEMGFTVT